jgi:hypothetical protein
MSFIRPLADDPECRLHFAKPIERGRICGDRRGNGFLKYQLSRLPTPAWLSRMALVSFGSIWALRRAPRFPRAGLSP